MILHGSLPYEFREHVTIAGLYRMIRRTLKSRLWFPKSIRQSRLRGGFGGSV